MKGLYFNQSPANERSWPGQQSLLDSLVEQISLMKPKAQDLRMKVSWSTLRTLSGPANISKRLMNLINSLSLNEKRSAVVQMVKLAEKERDSLEDQKNEAETYMLKELSLLKWQEKAAKLAYKDASAKMGDLQENITSLEEILNSDRGKIQKHNNALEQLEYVYNKHMKQQEVCISWICCCQTP